MTELSRSDLIVDTVYGGSRAGNASDDPLPKLLGIDSGSGFRHLGQRPQVKTLRLLVLKSSLKDPDWPDTLDTETGIFTYYGDRKSPGPLHDTPRQGNLILSNLFSVRHSSTSLNHFPPILIFGNTGIYRDVRFLGLAVPGAESLNQDEDLVAIWRATGVDNIRFQNYMAQFTVLSVPVISRAWLDDIQEGRAADSPHAPKVWLDWLKTRKYAPLAAPHTIETRTRTQQLPEDRESERIIQLIVSNYQSRPTDFERCALQIAKLMMPSITTADLTRPWRDGGRDAMGKYSIGNGPSAINVEFSLEAKCYGPANGVGVKDVSRLISRLRYRQFGILVTTSYVADQAYKELKEDRHPVVVIAAIDIVRVLRGKIGGIKSVKLWLSQLDHRDE